MAAISIEWLARGNLDCRERRSCFAFLLRDFRRQDWSAARGDEIERARSRAGNVSTPTHRKFAKQERSDELVSHPAAYHLKIQ
jgi:hypothetical protein